MTTEETGNTDIDTLASEPKPLTLCSGFEIEVLRLKTRATMSLLKILTRGASTVLGELAFSSEMRTEEFTGQLLGAMIVAIPEASDETVEFINMMVEPAGLKKGRKLSDADFRHNDELEEKLRDELEDPELDDLVTVLEQIIKNEGEHILALGKRLALLLRAQQASVTAKQGASSKRKSKD